DRSERVTRLATRYSNSRIVLIRRKGYSSSMDNLKKLIREVPDWPKKGILFYDITTLLKDKDGFRQLIDAMTAQFAGKHIDLVLGIEARGFIFGPALAYQLH